MEGSPWPVKDGVKLPVTAAAAAASHLLTARLNPGLLLSLVFISIFPDPSGKFYGNFGHEHGDGWKI